MYGINQLITLWLYRFFGYDVCLSKKSNAMPGTKYFWKVFGQIYLHIMKVYGPNNKNEQKVSNIISTHVSFPA